MTEFLFFCLGIIFTLILPVLWKKTMYDYCRAQLIDLKEEVRDIFIKEARGLEHPLYGHLINLIYVYVYFNKYFEEVGRRTRKIVIVYVFIYSITFLFFFAIALGWFPVLK